MMNLSNKTYILYSFCLTLLVVVITLIVSGSYFEEYEVVANQIILDHFTTSFTKVEAFNNVHFLLLPLYGKLTSLFPKIPIYSTIYVFYFSLAYFFIVLGTLIIIRKNIIKEHFWKSALIIFFITLLLIDSLISINNVRISILLIFAALIWLYILDLSRKRIAIYIILTTLFLSGLLMRMEIALLFTFTAFVFSVLFLNRKHTLVILSMLVCCVLTFQSYKIVNAKLFPMVKIMHKAEHELHDRQNINYDFLSEKALQKQIAMTFFLADSVAYSIDDYAALYEKKSLTSYVFNDDIVSKLKHKSIILIKDLKSHYWLFFVGLILVIYLTTHYKLFFESRIHFYKFSLFVVIFLVLPFILNLFLSVPNRFVIPYLSVATITLLIFIVVKKEERLKKEGLIVLCLVALVFTFFNNTYKVRLAKSQQQIASKFYDSLEELELQRKFAVINNINMDVYPSKLFSTSKSKNVSHYYLDFYFYYVYDYYIQHHTPFFGENYKSLEARLERCSKSDVLFYSNDDYNELLVNYMKIMHKVDVSFKPNGFFESENLKTYFLSINNEEQ